MSLLFVVTVTYFSGEELLIAPHNERDNDRQAKYLIEKLQHHAFSH